MLGCASTPMVEPAPPRASRSADGILLSAARLLLLALALLLPFEAELFSVGPLTITLPELLLYALIAAWLGSVVAHAAKAAPPPQPIAGGSEPSELVDRASRPAGDRAGTTRALRDPVARAVIAWVAVAALSAIAARSHRGAALKFTLRTLSGALLYFAARDLVRPPPMARRLYAALAAGAVLSASLTLVEALRPDWSWWWRPFREQEFSARGIARASGPFAFPNIAAMYWEAALPLLLVVGARARLARLLLAAVLIHGILATATRASIFGVAAIALLLLALAGGRRLRRGRWSNGDATVARFAGGVLILQALLAVLVLWHQGTASMIGQRLLWWREPDWYRARYVITAGQSPAAPLTMVAGSTRAIPVEVHNIGGTTWYRDFATGVQLGYHWSEPGSEPGSPPASAGEPDTGRLTLLPRDVPPGGAAVVAGVVDAPARPGTYTLLWDLVHDRTRWFSTGGNPTGDQRVTVEPPAPGSRAESRPAPAVEGEPLPTRGELWTAALRLWRRHPVLGVGPDNFRRRYPEVIRHADGRPFTDQRMHANNLYLETLADLGLAGLAALLLLVHALATAARAALNRAALDRTSAPGAVPPLALPALLGLAAYLLHGTVDTFFAFTPTLGLWWMLVALAGREQTGGDAA